MPNQRKLLFDQGKLIIVLFILVRCCLFRKVYYLCTVAMSSNWSSSQKKKFNLNLQE